MLKRLFWTSIDKIRNIGIVAHIDAGKTTTTERMLYYSGYTKRIGDVDRGDTVMDYLPEERERGITITSAAIQFPWKDHEINLIDTPGHVDFTFEVERCLRVLDGCVTILDASAGVQAQTRTVWRQSQRHNLPKIVFVNKLDKVGASFERCIADVRDVLKTFPIPVQRPIANGKVLDLIKSKILTWTSTDGSIIREDPIDEDHKIVFEEAKDEMLEQIAEKDDEFLDLYLIDQTKITPADIQAAIRRLTISGIAVPVLAGASYQNIGVQPLLDAVINYLPSPPSNSDEKLRMLAFKCIHDHQKGMMVYVRVYSGMFRSRTPLFNMNTCSTEVPSKILKAFSNDFEEVSELKAGDIGVLLGLKSAKTGDTLILAVDKASPDMMLEGIIVPEPVFFCSVEPHSASEEVKLDTALDIISREDPSLKVIRDRDSGQTLLNGVGELHLEIIQNRLQKELGIKADFGSLRISYRECPRESAEECLDLNENCKLVLKLEPSLDSPNGIALIGFPAYSVDTLNAIIHGSLQRSPRSGHPIINANVELKLQNSGADVDHAVLCKNVSILISRLFSNIPLLALEPVMKLTIECPTDFTGTIMNDLHSRRRGNVQMHRSSDIDPSIQIIEAEAPLSELLGYSSHLRSLSHGQASLIMEPSGFRPSSGD